MSGYEIYAAVSLLVLVGGCIAAGATREPELVLYAFFGSILWPLVVFVILPMGALYTVGTLFRKEPKP